MRIACFECDPYEQRILQEKLQDHEVVWYDHPLEPTDLQSLSFIDALVIFIYSPITKEIIEKLPFLKLIVTRSTGYDHIDLATCQQHGVTVCNVPKYGGTAVAEHTFALMLSLMRHIPQAVARTNHDEFSLENLRGKELAGKTLGVIGAGTIGSEVIKRAQAFDMNILVHERTPSKKKAKEERVTHVSLPVLLKNADVISLHVPHTPETHHIINSAAIRRMKPGAILINTARGELVDTNALQRALTTGHIAAAALDVLEGEAQLKEAHQPLKNHHHKSSDWVTIRHAHKLLKLPNVIVTPHIGFYTEEALQTILTTTAENITAFAYDSPINTIRK